jgi:hypothetical protein
MDVAMTVVTQRHEQVYVVLSGGDTTLVDVMDLQRSLLSAPLTPTTGALECGLPRLRPSG